ncbi:MAG: alpha-L-fucosidase, partial [Promethearchaeota archaeon]
HDKYKRKMAAYYYNRADEWGMEVEIFFKDFNLPPGIGVQDYERGSSSKLTHHKWITDTSIGWKSWSYVENEEYKPATTIIHELIDNISKNGYLLLNFGPKASGEIPAEVKERFEQIGAWIDINKEAIFNSTPWVLAGEGPTTKTDAGSFSEQKDFRYKPEDIRFVVKNNCLYAFCLGMPENEITIKSLTKPPVYKNKDNFPDEFYIIEESDIKSIHLLGLDGELTWKLTNQGLKIQIPEEKPCSHAITIKIAWS